MSIAERVAQRYSSNRYETLINALKKAGLEPFDFQPPGGHEKVVAVKDRRVNKVQHLTNESLTVYDSGQGAPVLFFPNVRWEGPTSW